MLQVYFTGIWTNDRGFRRRAACRSYTGMCWGWSCGYQSMYIENMIFVEPTSLSETLLLQLLFGVCACIHSNLSEPWLLQLWMDFKIIWHNCSSSWVDVPFKGFILVGQRSRSQGLDELSLDNLLVEFSHSYQTNLLWCQCCTGRNISWRNLNFKIQDQTEWYM